MAHRRSVLLVALSLAALVALAACIESDAEEGQTDDAPAAVEDFDPTAPELNVESLAAEGEVAAFEATAYPVTYVGEVTDNQFIGIALPGGTYTGQAEEVSVYLCDGDSIGLYLNGEIEPDVATRLEREDIMVDLAISDNVFTGIVTLVDGSTHGFAAFAASGDAGLYWAETTVDNVDYRANWIVLEDGRQRGLVCCLEWWCPIPGCWPR